MGISMKAVLAAASAAALLGGCATGPYYQDGYGYGPGYHDGYGSPYYGPGYVAPSVGLGIYIDRDDDRRWRGDRDGRRDGRRDRDGRDARNDWRGDRDRSGGGRDSRGDHGQNSPG